MLDLRKNQKQALIALENSTVNICLNMFMRTGKTAVAIHYINNFVNSSSISNPSILWIAESADERDRDLKVEFINTLPDGESLYNAHIETIHIRSLKSKLLSAFDLIIYNECQSITEKSYNLLKKFNKRIVALTGTYPKKYNKLKFLTDLGLDTVYKYSMQHAIEDGIIPAFKVKVLEVPLSIENDIYIENPMGQNFYTSEYKSVKRLTSQLYEIDKVIDVHKPVVDNYQIQIDKFKDYYSETEENKTILRSLFTKSGELRAILKPLYAEKGIVSLRLSITLNKTNSTIEASKKYLREKIEFYKNNSNNSSNPLLKPKYLVFCNSVETSNKISKFTFNSDNTPEVNNKNYTAFENNELSHLILINKGGTGYTYHNLTGILSMNINGSSEDMMQKLARTLLFRDNYTPDIVYFISKGTKQKEWLQKALEDYINPVDMIYEDYS